VGADQSIFISFWHAGIVVKLVLMMLLGISVTSWTIIFQRWQMLKNTIKQSENFEQLFWSGITLNQLYHKVEQPNHLLQGIPMIFRAGFKEFAKLRESKIDHQELLEATQLAMEVENRREVDKLEQNLSLLATAGSTSPYIGLFGTVWGMMTALQALGSVQQASISMVAPGISEALIATAFGLFAAIPAVIAYNRLSSKVERLSSDFCNFQDEFTAILRRQMSQQHT
jgi:biopolymer transport protein TolQ